MLTMFHMNIENHSSCMIPPWLCTYNKLAYPPPPPPLTTQELHEGNEMYMYPHSYFYHPIIEVYIHQLLTSRMGKHN